MDRKTTFGIALLYLLVILILGLLFFTRRSWLFFVPDANAFGPVPVGVPWFGALGAVLISLTGVFDHKRDWDNDFWPWHVARPLIGIGLGVVSVIILQAGILAVGSSPQPQANSHPAQIPSNLLYYLVAFLVGYREETFRDLIKRLVDVILTPGAGSSIIPTINAVNPTQALHSAAIQVIITGAGLTSTQSVKFGQSVGQFTVNSDAQLTVTTPMVQAAGAVPLTVTTKGGSATIPFTFT